MVNYRDVFIIEKGKQISYSNAPVYPTAVYLSVFVLSVKFRADFLLLLFFLQEDAEAKKTFIFNTASVRCCVGRKKNE